MKKILVSACLVGICCKYSGEDNRSEEVLNLIESNILIPVCPEQLGGLTTPRRPVEIWDGQFLTEDRANYTAEFKRGAYETLKIAKLLKIDYAILKENSPSCGVNSIYDGTFSNERVPGSGETARILKENGYEVISDEELCKI
jgi:uncharacterized protein YbbK (DUF523 family)